MKNLLIITGFLVAILNIYLFWIPDKQTDLNYFFNLAYALIFFISGFTAYAKSTGLTISKNMSKSLFTLGTGMICFGMGLVVWTYYNLAAKIEIPYPSLADLFFLLYYPFIIVGIYYLINAIGTGPDKKLVIEGVLVFIILSAILYIFLDQTSQDEVGPVASLLSISYIVCDSLITSFAITILRVQKKSFDPQILYFVFGFLILATADTIFSYRTAREIYWNGDISDTLFALSGFLTGMGFLNMPSEGGSKD